MADRLCGSSSDPIIRNEQERRQLNAIENWLKTRGYRLADDGVKFNKMKPGTYRFRLNIPIQVFSGGLVVNEVNIPVDVAIMPKGARSQALPLLIEAKSAGDFTNTNKRRKEEAIKMQQLISSHGRSVRFILFLCGYFGSDYLGYEAAEGIDWVWEHRIDDLAQLGL